MTLGTLIARFVTRSRSPELFEFSTLWFPPYKTQFIDLPIVQQEGRQFPLEDIHLQAQSQIFECDWAAFEKPEILRVRKLTVGEDGPLPCNLLVGITEADTIGVRYSLAPCKTQGLLETLESSQILTSRFLLGEPSIISDMQELMGIFESAVWVSSNLFVPMGPASCSGKDYKARNVPSQEQLFPRVSSLAEGEKGFQKSYNRVRTPGALSTHTTTTLSIWDLIYPLLLPPLNLDFVPQFDVLEKLRGYQKKGITFLVERDAALLADEMGTGKTVMALVSLRILFRLAKAKRALIVCPVSVLGVWQEHLKDWACELEFTVVRGSRETRKLDWTYPAHVFLTTYDTVASDFLTVIRGKKSFKCDKCGTILSFQQKVHLDENGTEPNYDCPKCKSTLKTLPVSQGLVPPDIFEKFDVTILDEAQFVKNTQTDRSRAVRLVKSKIRWALTGTPLETKLDDLAAIFAFLKPGYMKTEYLTPQRARHLMEPFFLRRRKEDVLTELPQKIRQEEWLDLDEDQRNEYQNALGIARKELEDLGEEVSKVHIFAQIVKLKRICNFARGKALSPKTEALCDIVSEVKLNGKKVLVFTQWQDEYGVKTLRDVLAEFGVVILKGGLSDRDRKLVESRFKNDASVSVLLATVKTGGVGLTLTSASYVVHFDHWWNPATMWQAEDRAHRIGQKDCVNVYSFWVRDTIEENIHRKLADRSLQFKEVVDSLSESAINEMISTEEWLDMLGVMRTKDARLAPEPKIVESRISVSQIYERIQAIDPLQFEVLVKTVFERLGMSNVRTTKRSHDGGIDLQAVRNSPGGSERVVAQCKRSPRIGVDVAREFYGVISTDNEIAKGFLVTSGTASPECRMFCERQGRLALIEGNLLASYIHQYGIWENTISAKTIN